MKPIDSIIGELPSHHKQGVILALKLATEFEQTLLEKKVEESPSLTKTTYDNEWEEYAPCVGQSLANLKPIPYTQPEFKNGKSCHED